MNKHVSLAIASAAWLGLTQAALIVDDADPFSFPLITVQPTDQFIGVGSSATFSVQATNGVLGFQWWRNGVALDGQTNRTITIENVGTNDVGYYTCQVIKAEEAVPTRSASLNVFTALSRDTIIVYGTPVSGGGSQGTCPGTYAGYVNYAKTASQGWGWAPSTNTTIHTASDGAGRTDTKIQYFGRSGDNGCAQTTVTIPDPTFSTKYRFTIYFTNNVPTNAYPITLSGFNP